MSEPRNYIVYTWHGRFNHWVQRERLSSLCDAAIYADRFGNCTTVVIDLVTGRVIRKDGTPCDLKRPKGIKSLPAVERVQEPAKSSPYSFTNANGVLIEMAPYIGEPFPDFSGHANPISKEEMAVICARKDRESALIRALRAMWGAGEREAALRRVKEIFGNTL